MKPTYTVTLEERLSTSAVMASGLKFTPVRYSHRAKGGPHRAEITVEGNEVALWQGLNNIGRGIRIYSQYGDQVWWGYVHEARLTVGVFDVRISMDEVANKVRVAYSYIEPGTNEAGGRELTDWIYDGESIEQYGLKELTHSTSGATSDHAENLRSLLLAEMKVPIPNISLIGSKHREPKLTYYCRGWWQSLDWRYMTRQYIQYSYQDTKNGGLEFGGGAGSVQMVAQSFTVPATLALKSVHVGIYKIGAISDNAVMTIRSDSGGSPDATLGTSNSVPASQFQTGVFTWTKFKFNTAVNLTASTTYWIVLDRDGSDSASNYFVVNLDFGGTYADGQTKWYNGSAWTTASVPASDMPFTITGEVVDADTDTATQIKDIIEDAGSVVPINTAEVIDASGVLTSPYREGDNTALYEIEELMELGTTNNRRLLARVLSNKTVQIYEEPANTAVGYVNKTGDIYDSYGGRMRKETCPVGIWVDLRSVAPAGASFGIIGAQTAMFIEESEYDVEREELRIEPREHVGAFDFLRIRNG